VVKWKHDQPPHNTRKEPLPEDGNSDREPGQEDHEAGMEQISGMEIIAKVELIQKFIPLILICVAAELKNKDK